MNQTIVQKIIAQHAGREAVYPGDIVDVAVDRLMINDLNGPGTFKKFLELQVQDVCNKEGIMVVMDHKMPSWEYQHVDAMNYCRDFCKIYGIDNFKDLGRHGISHQVMCEKFVRPGEIAVGTDSHATMYGGMGALGCGINASDAAVIMATGKTWMMVPESILITLKGRPKKGVTAKDIALKIMTIAPLEHFTYKSVEITGDYAHEISVDGRLVITNLICETGAKCGIFAPDAVVADYLGEPVCNIAPDKDAVYYEKFEIDLEKLEPVLACPHEVSNVKDLSEVEGIKIDQAILGSCTNGRIEDFLQAAEIMRGHRVHPDVRMIIVPSSQKVFLDMTKLGLTELFTECGAAIISPSCACCAGFGPGRIGSGEVCISTTNRNWQGRLGAKSSSIYLGSAYEVAAAAVAGEIVSPLCFLDVGGEI